LDEVEIKSVPFIKIDDKTGYIVLSHFNKASNETKEALEELKKQGAERIILDVRDNPGGLLNEAVIFAIYSFQKRDYCYYKIKIEKHNSTYKTTKDPVDTEIPLIILVNRSLPPKSWLALQDLDRAVVVGSRFWKRTGNDRLI
jgi:carboxyl-terminal processing protease